MKVEGKKGIGNILKIFVQICFILGVIFLIVLPFILQQLGFKLGASIFIIYPNGIVLLIIAYQFIKLFDSLKNENPFCNTNVKILKRTGIVALVGAIFWLIDLLYEIILAKSNNIIFLGTLGFLTILFFGVSIALYILAELLKKATEYKEENELTI